MALPMKTPHAMEPSETPSGSGATRGLAHGAGATRPALLCLSPLKNARVTLHPSLFQPGPCPPTCWGQTESTRHSHVPSWGAAAGEVGAGEQTEGPSVKVHFGWDRRWVRVLEGEGQLVGRPREPGTWRVLGKSGRNGEHRAKARGGGGAGRIGRLGSPELESEFPVGG